MVVEWSTYESGIELGRIDTCQDRLNAIVDHLPSENRGRAGPEGEQGPYACSVQRLLPVLPDVLEKEVTEDNGLNPAAGSNL